MEDATKEKMLKIGKGALIAGAGAAITYILQEIPSIDFGDWTPIVVAVNSVIVNIVRKFLTSTNTTTATATMTS